MEIIVYPSSPDSIHASFRLFEMGLISCWISAQMQRLLNLSWIYNIFLKFASGNTEKRANVLDDRIRIQRDLIMSKFEHISKQYGSPYMKLRSKGSENCHEEKTEVQEQACNS